MSGGAQARYPPGPVPNWLSSDIPPEGELLLSCVRTQIDPATRKRISQLIDEGPNWSYLCSTAARNNVVPLLRNGLLDTNPESVPQQVLDSLGDQVSTIVAANEDNLRLLLKVLDLFDEHEIPVVPFKGVTFALFVYGNLSLRPIGDIDLLVQRKDFLRARDLLIRHGYRHIYFGHAEVSTVQAQLGRDDGRTGIDLHYGLTPQYQHTNMPEARAGSSFEPSERNTLTSNRTHWFFSLDCAPLWKRLGRVSVENKELPVFSPEDLLLVASINGTKENWRALCRVCDIAELVRAHPGMDWDRILEEVNALHWERKFLLGLQLAHELLNMALPVIIVHRISALPTVNSLTLQTCRRFCLDKLAADHEQFRRISALLTMDKTTDRMRYLRYICRVLNTSKGLRNLVTGYVHFLREICRQIGLLITCQYPMKQFRLAGKSFKRSRG